MFQEPNEGAPGWSCIHRGGSARRKLSNQDSHRSLLLPSSLLHHLRQWKPADRGGFLVSFTQAYVCRHLGSLFQKPWDKSCDSTGASWTPGPWTPGNAPACLEESVSVETIANVQLATVKHVEKAAVLAAPRAVPSVPRAASAKEARTSAAAVPEPHPWCWGWRGGSCGCHGPRNVCTVH
ncbi:metallothionein-4 isoform X2 [Vulpes lagopus]|nr:metallothionein-4 isoform X2 [Vulpes lagopus]